MDLGILEGRGVSENIDSLSLTAREAGVQRRRKAKRGRVRRGQAQGAFQAWPHSGPRPRRVAEKTGA